MGLRSSLWGQKGQPDAFTPVSATGRDAATQVTKSEGSIKGIHYKSFVHLSKTKISISWTKVEAKKSL